MTDRISSLTVALADDWREERFREVNEAFRQASMDTRSTEEKARNAAEWRQRNPDVVISLVSYLNGGPLLSSPVPENTGKHS